MKRLVSVAALTAAAAVLAVPVAASGSVQAAKPTLTVRSSSFGKVLFDGRGFVLYAFTKDAKNRSTCFGECARAWPPYIAKGAMKVGRGLDQAKLGTTKRPNGSLQVTYGGRPLYYYVGDKSPGEIRCQDVFEFGGTWLVVRGSSALVR